MRKVLRKLYAFIKWIKWDGNISVASVNNITFSDSLKEKRVVVTGGSDGIGLAIAKTMLESGAEVLITGRNKEKLQLRKEELSNPRLHILQWDVSVISSIESKLNECIRILGRIDVFVNNAGFLERFRKDEEYFDKVMTTNLKSVHYICQYLIEYYLATANHSYRKIINISSMNAFQGAAHPYYYSKRAMNSITEGLGRKYASEKIIVNGIAPGICASSINYQDVSDNAYYAGNSIKRVVLPEEIASIACFLATDAANGIVGQTIICDGGETLR